MPKNLKISDVVKKLNHIKKLHGDLEVDLNVTINPQSNSLWVIKDKDDRIKLLHDNMLHIEYQEYEIDGEIVERANIRNFLYEV